MISVSSKNVHSKFLVMSSDTKQATMTTLAKLQHSGQRLIQIGFLLTSWPYRFILQLTAIWFPLKKMQCSSTSTIKAVVCNILCWMMHEILDWRVYTSNKECDNSVGFLLLYF